MASMAFLDRKPRVSIADRWHRWFAREPQAPSAVSRPSLPSWREAMFEDVGAFLIQHDLDPTPENYALGFEYIAAGNARLVAAVRAEIARVGKLDARVAEQIFDDAGAGASANRLAELAGRMATQAKGLTRIARQSGRDAEEFVSALETQPGPEAAGLPVIELARQMADRTRRAEQQLKNAQGELQTMRITLADAQHAADIDSLTDLPNRRAFKRALDVMLMHAKDEASPLNVAFCDIDHFKSINDRFGHAAGDRVLSYVATTLRRDLSGMGTVARFGGEEFVVAMPGVALTDAHGALDACREALSARNLIATENGATIGSVTFSAGLTAWKFGDDTAALLRRADEALYKAKDAGRNRVALG